MTATTSQRLDASRQAPGAAAGAFLASSGSGGVLAIDAFSTRAVALADAFAAAGRWDNHLAAAP